MKSIARAFVIALLAAGCADNPYVESASKDEGGVSGIKFAYGRYCGAGNPVLHRNGESGVIRTDITQLWPPVDDLDAICYAHDYCHQYVNGSLMLCDYALLKTLSDFAEDFENPACLNLISDMSIGMNFHMSTYNLQAQSGWILVAPLLRGMSQTRAGTDDYPAEGDCRLTTRGVAPMVIDAFEYYFDKSKASYAKADIVVEHPPFNKTMDQIENRSSPD